MAGLSAEQADALTAVADAHRVRVTVRADAEREAAALIATRLESAALVESRAVRRAVALGVPKTRIGREGLGSKDYASVGRVLALTDGEAAAEQAVARARHTTRVRRATSAETGYWSDELRAAGDVLLRLDWVGFDVADDSDLRIIYGREAFDLHGFVHRWPGLPDEWQVLEDDDAAEWAAFSQTPLEMLLQERHATLQDVLARTAEP